ncbi:hypothetical protein ElyMa_005117400 [Elysia marginata]|uniref:Uncharacterized protein n=1 Tax=Elysia marginata TaxID=1093978 RepID=A0AAV4JN22_9GAST|nr:hypothetical protein ElyMa_005117400 [Elysia marginata]
MVATGLHRMVFYSNSSNRTAQNGLLQSWLQRGYTEWSFYSNSSNRTAQNGLKLQSWLQRGYTEWSFKIILAATEPHRMVFYSHSTHRMVFYSYGSNGPAQNGRDEEHAQVSFALLSCD